MYVFRCFCFNKDDWTGPHCIYIVWHLSSNANVLIIYSQLMLQNNFNPIMTKGVDPRDKVEEEQKSIASLVFKTAGNACTLNCTK